MNEIIQIKIHIRRYSDKQITDLKDWILAEYERRFNAEKESKIASGGNQ